MDFYVYVWTCVASGQRYIGKGKGRRSRQHFSNARGKRGNDCPAFYAAIRKYGEGWFELDYIATGLTAYMACALERTFIAMYGTRAEYNCTDGGDGALGRAQSDRVKAAVSAAQKGKKVSSETRARMAEAKTGKKQSQETVSKRRDKLLGKKRTPEQRARLAEGARRPSAKRPGKMVLTVAHKINMCILRQLGSTFAQLNEWFEMSETGSFYAVKNHQARNLSKRYDTE